MSHFNMLFAPQVTEQKATDKSFADRESPNILLIKNLFEEI